MENFQLSSFVYQLLISLSQTINKHVMWKEKGKPTLDSWVALGEEELKTRQTQLALQGQALPLRTPELQLPRQRAPRGTGTGHSAPAVSLQTGQAVCPLPGSPQSLRPFPRWPLPQGSPPVSPFNPLAPALVPSERPSGLGLENVAF